MNKPTPEQIEAEARERFPELDHKYASLTYPAEAMRAHNRSAFESGARWAALVAAAGVTPQEPAEGLTALVRTLRECGVDDGIDMTDAVAAAWACARPVQVDEAKLAEVIDAAQVIRARGEDGNTSVAFASGATIAHAVAEATAEWLRGGGQ